MTYYDIFNLFPIYCDVFTFWHSVPSFFPFSTYQVFFLVFFLPLTFWVFFDNDASLKKHKLNSYIVTKQ